MLHDPIERWEWEGGALPADASRAANEMRGESRERRDTLEASPSDAAPIGESSAISPNRCPAPLEGDEAR